MKHGLRSRLTKYGDEEFALFLRRGFLKAAGYTDDALDRPVVGILSTASDFNPCHGNAPQIAERIARGVRLAGGLPFCFPTISLKQSSDRRERNRVRRGRYGYPSTTIHLLSRSRQAVHLDVERVSGD